MTATPANQAPPGVDHLVVLAADLASGAQWCERTLGVHPAAGGKHPLMGTHNRLLQLSGPARTHAYLEIIAIDPGAEKTRTGCAKRWFDIDDPALQRQVARQGPQLIHWLASVPDLSAARAALAAAGLDRGGAIVDASRPTPQGLLRWRITLREDGQRLMDGCLPTLIEWGQSHPCEQLPTSGVQLQTMTLRHPQSALLQAACTAIGPIPAVSVAPAAAAQLLATLSTPLGPVILSSHPA